MDFRKQIAIVSLLCFAMTAAAKRRSVGTGRVDQIIRCFQEHSAKVPFTTPSFWAWELQLAIARDDQELARALARVLYGLQEPDGSWPLGTAWEQRGEWDFKNRLADDAESWEVAEVGNALLDYAQAFNDLEAVSSAARGAEYLKKSIEYVDEKPFLPHMPECNHVLQPHSTINAALLLSRIEGKGHAQLAAELVRAGLSMNFRRVIANPDKLKPPFVGTQINDYEIIQIGYYLLQMNDPYGRELLDRYRDMQDINYVRGAAYLVLVYTRLGEHDKAKHFAMIQKRFAPRRGHEYALRDFINHVLISDGTTPAGGGPTSSCAGK